MANITTLYAIHATQADHLDEVKAAMVSLGAPSIRVVDCGDFYMAIEGCHRLAACAELGIAPELIVLAQDDMVDAGTLDLENLDKSEQYTAGEIAGELYSSGAVAYWIEDDGTICGK